MRRLLPTLLFVIAATLPARAWVSLRYAVNRDGSGEASLMFDAPPRDGAAWRRALVAATTAPVDRLSTRWESSRGPWTMSAVIPQLPKRGTLVRGRFDPRPVARLARQQGETLALVVVETPLEATARVPGARRMEEDEGDIGRWYNATEIRDRPIVVEWGIPPGQAARALAWPLLALLAPVLIAALGARAAVRARVDDPARVWFGHWRLLRMLVFAIWMAWGVILAVSPASRVVEFAGGLSEGGRLASRCIFLLVPPLLAGLACHVASWPVAVKVRGAEWTGMDVLRQAAWSLLAGPAAAVLAFSGFGSMLDGRAAGAASGLLGGFMALMFGRIGHARAAGMRWNAVSTGELRDAVFALAEKAGVQLRGVFVIPAGRGRLVNAFAGTGGSLLFSDALVAQFSRRELLAVAAHEITHLRKGHAGRVRGRMAVLAAVVFVAAGWAVAALSSRMERSDALIPLALPLGVLVVAWSSRRRERAADAGSAELTDDPEAMITALVRLSRLNAIPVAWSRWDERFLTHPSTRHRAEALARTAGISDARLAELLDPPEPSAEGFPLSAAHADRLFSTTWKTDTLLLLGWSQMAAAAIPLAVVARLALHQPPLVCFAVGTAVAAVAWWLVYARVSGRALLKLAGPLAMRLEAQGIPAARGQFVTLAPHGDPRVYEGFSEWDAGYLFADERSIAYVGEQARFRLPLEDVGVETVYDSAPLIREAAVRVTWPGGALRLLAPSGSRGASRRATEALAARLRAPSGPPVPLPSMGPPDFGEVTSRPQWADARVSGLLGNGLVTGAIGYAVTLIAGCPAGRLATTAAALNAAFAVVPYLPALLRARRERKAHSGGEAMKDE